MDVFLLYFVEKYYCNVQRGLSDPAELDAESRHIKILKLNLMYICRYEPCQKHRLGTVSNLQLLVGFNQFYERSILTLASGMIHRHYSEYAQTVCDLVAINTGNKHLTQVSRPVPMFSLEVL